MGEYTHFKLNIDVPVETAQAFDRAKSAYINTSTRFGPGEKEVSALAARDSVLANHEFFLADNRKGFIFAYSQIREHGFLTFRLSIDAEFKNYDKDVELFLDWLRRNLDHGGTGEVVGETTFVRMDGNEQVSIVHENWDFYIEQMGWVSARTQPLEGRTERRRQLEDPDKAKPTQSTQDNTRSMKVDTSDLPEDMDDEERERIIEERAKEMLLRESIRGKSTELNVGWDSKAKVKQRDTKPKENKDKKRRKRKEQKRSRRKNK